MALEMTYGERIKNAREARMWTQYELGLAIGERDGSISRWERGRLTPKVHTLVDVSAALGVSMDYLTGVTDKLVLSREWRDPRRDSATQALARLPEAAPVGKPRPARRRAHSSRSPRDK